MIGEQVSSPMLNMEGVKRRLMEELNKRQQEHNVRVEAISQSMAVMREKIVRADRESDLTPLCGELVTYLQKVSGEVSACEPAARTRLLAEIWYTVIQAQDVGVFNSWIDTTFSVKKPPLNSAATQWNTLTTVADTYFHRQTGRRVRASQSDTQVLQNLSSIITTNKLRLGISAEPTDSYTLLALMSLSRAEAQLVRMQTEMVVPNPAEEKRKLFSTLCARDANHAEQLLQFLSSMKPANESAAQAVGQQTLAEKTSVAVEQQANTLLITPDRIQLLPDSITLQVQTPEGAQLHFNLLNAGFKSLRHTANNEIIYTVTDMQNVTRQLVCTIQGNAQLTQFIGEARKQQNTKVRVEKHPVQNLAGTQFDEQGLPIINLGGSADTQVPVATSPTEPGVFESKRKTVELADSRTGESVVAEAGPQTAVDITGVKGEKNLHRSKVVEVPKANVVGSTSTPSPDRVRIVVGGGPKAGKEDLGGVNRNKIKYTRAPEGVVVTGGQDAVGSAKFVYAPHIISERLKNNQAVIHSLSASCDGASYGADQAATADMAEELVDTVVGAASFLVRNGLAKDRVAAEVEKKLQIVHEKMQQMRTPKGEYKTAATAAVSILMTANNDSGEPCLYLENLFVGDANCIILAEGVNGLEIYKLLDPADGLLDVILQKGIDMDSLSIVDRNRVRAEQIQAIADRLGGTPAAYQQAKDTYTGPGIIHAIGEENSRYKLRKQRLNLTKEFAAKKHKRIWVMTCSDNAGEKVNVGDIKNIFNAAVKNRQSFPVLLAQVMEQRSEDDSSFALQEVKL